MISASDPSHSGVLVSGGLDSCVLLSWLAEQGQQVQPFYILSGLVWQTEELAALQRYLDQIASDRVAPLVVLDLPLADLYAGHWSVTGQGVPDETTSDEAVYMPGRNPLLVIKTALWCQLHGLGTLALATLRSNPFADAGASFFDQFQAALSQGMAKKIELSRPFATLSKTQVMQLGRGYPLEQTFSCIAPRGGLHCGHCNKCAERKAAFRQAEIPDRTRYASSQLQPLAPLSSRR